MASVGGLLTIRKVKSVLPQSSGKWLRVLIVVQQQSFQLPNHHRCSSDRTQQTPLLGLQLYSTSLQLED